MLASLQRCLRVSPIQQFQHHTWQSHNAIWDLDTQKWRWDSQGSRPSRRMSRAAHPPCSSNPEEQHMVVGRRRSSLSSEEQRNIFKNVHGRIKDKKNSCLSCAVATVAERTNISASWTQEEAQTLNHESKWLCWNPFLDETIALIHVDSSETSIGDSTHQKPEHWTTITDVYGEHVHS